MIIAGEVDGVTVYREWIFQSDRLRAYCDNPTSPRARANFDHRRLGRSAFDEAQLFGGVVRHGYASLVIQSASNDYYLNDDLPDLRLALAAYCARFDDVSGIGFSMGGFAALILSKALNFSNLWLVSPMSPSFPKLPPFDRDMDVERAVFDRYGPAALGGIKRGLRGVVMFDPYFELGRDRAYSEFVQTLCPKISLLAMPWGGHPSTQFLSEIKHYSPMLRATFQPKIRAKALKKVQRSLRLKSPLYCKGLQEYLETRAARIIET
jgi:hypothetical protein